MASSLASEVVLYGYWRSSCSWRVRTGLALKRVVYRTEPVHLVEGVQKSTEYSGKNPMKQVPTLLIDGQYLTQSVAILEYLEETRRFQGTRLLPECPKERAQVRRLTEIINSGIQPIQNLNTLVRLQSYLGKVAPSKEVSELRALRGEWGKQAIQDGFTALESELKRTSGKFCVGDELSMADCCLVPQVYNAVRFGIDVSEFPIISRINDECLKHPAFQAAHPDQQPDAPPASKL